MKKAVLSIDVEDWYHLDYFNKNNCDTSYSMLDGLNQYIDLIDELSLPSSFFVLGEIAEKRIDFFKDLALRGHDISSHGWDHQRPMTMNEDTFKKDIQRCYEVMAEINDGGNFGYRAPCFSLDRKRLEIIKELGFSYDSSRIEFDDHPLYGSLDMSGFNLHEERIFRHDNFFEFEVSTVSILGKNIPISGGGYLRIFPWIVMKQLIKKYLNQNELYVLYIHPFELSQLAAPNLPSSTSNLTKFRFDYGRSKVIYKIKKLIDLLDKNGYEFSTFSKIRNEIID